MNRNNGRVRAFTCTNEAINYNISSDNTLLRLQFLDLAAESDRDLLHIRNHSVHRQHERSVHYAKDLDDDLSTDSYNERLPLTISFIDISCFVPMSQPIWSKFKRRRPQDAIEQQQQQQAEEKDFTMVEMRPILSRSTTVFTHNDDEKIILQPFSGCIKPGELLAVMGPSGSGKTTFLESLANRIPSNRRRGDIFVNSVPLNDEISRKCFGFVWQQDALHENLTVKETLEYVCRLRFKYKKEEVSKRVREVMDELGLNSCANTKIGGQSFRGISGGERKRVSIAIELLANPSVLFLDEPTTGLDSCTALHIVQTLKNLAEKNRTVICTIHQPQTHIFRLFDRILLMSRGGRVVYFGAGGDDSVEYFEKLGFHCDEFTNPSDHFLDIINTFPRNKKKHKKKKDHASTVELDKVATPMTSSPGLPEFYNELTADGRVDFLVESYKSSALCQQNSLEAQENVERFHLRQESEISLSELSPSQSNQTLNLNQGQVFATRNKSTETLVSSPRLDSLKRSLSLPFMSKNSRKDTMNAQDILQMTNQRNAPNWIIKFWVLSLRQFKEYGRNKTATVFRLIQSALIGLFIGLIYFQCGQRNDQKAAQDRRGVLFFLSMQQAMLGSITVMTLFHGWERIVFQREYSSSLYSVSIYYASKFLAELPFQVLSPILFGVVTYFMVGLSQTVHQIFIFMACIIMITLCGQAVGIAISVWSPSLDIANIVSPFFLGLTLLCSGFFITITNVPSWLYWTTQIDFITYANQILAVNDLTGLTFTCDPLPKAIPNPATMSWGQKFWFGLTRPFRKQQIADATNQYLNGTITPCIVRTGEEMLEQMSFDQVSIPFNFLVIILMTIGLHIVAFIGLKYYVAGRFRK